MLLIAFRAIRIVCIMVHIDCRRQVIKMALFGIMNTRKNKVKPARLRFADNMRMARLRMRISQEELAERCGLHRTYIGSVERGERNISIDNMEAISVALGQDLTELLVE